jgi:hypothetical protein
MVSIVIGKKRENGKRLVKVDDGGVIYRSTIHFEAKWFFEKGRSGNYKIPHKYHAIVRKEAYAKTAQEREQRIAASDRYRRASRGF